MKFIKSGIAVLACAVLAGCMQPEGYPQPITAAPAKIAAKRGFQADRITQQRPVTVRTFVALDEKGKQLQEVPGAKCVVSTPELQARVVTPQQLQLPTVKGKPGPMSVSCERGAQKGVQTLTARLPVTSTSVAGTGSGAAFAVGLIATVAINAALQNKAMKDDEWTYMATDATELRVLLK